MLIHLHIWMEKHTNVKVDALVYSILSRVIVKDDFLKMNILTMKTSRA